MRYSKKIIALLVLLTMVLVTVGCGNKNADTQQNGQVTSANEEPDQKQLKIGLVYSLGGRGDKGINDMMYYAMEKISKENNWEYSDLENEQASNVEPANRQFCEQGKDVIINFGFGCIDVVNKLSLEYPEIIFITIDAITEPRPNVLNFTFKEHEGAFLVGIVAGLMTETGKVGFVGGMENDMIKGFNAGYIQGVKTVAPDVQVLSAYCGSTVEAFGDPTKGKEIALSFYDAGADIVFHAAGGSGLGVFEAAIAKDKWAIGVDTNQWAEAPDNILTSMLKRCDTAIETALKSIADGTFEPGSVILGAAEDGVGYVKDDTAHLPPKVIETVDEYLEKVKSGEIVVTNKL